MPSGHRCASQTSIHFSKLGAPLVIRCTSRPSFNEKMVEKCIEFPKVQRAFCGAPKFERCGESAVSHRSFQGAQRPRNAPQFPRRTKAPQCTEVSKAHRSPVPRRGFQAHRARMVHRVFHEQTFPIANARHEGHPRRFDMPKTLRWSNGNAGRAARPVRFGPRLPACPASSAHQVTRSEPAPARDALTTCRAPRPRGPRDPRAP